MRLPRQSVLSDDRQKVFFNSIIIILILILIIIIIIIIIIILLIIIIITRSNCIETADNRLSGRDLRAMIGKKSRWHFSAAAERPEQAAAAAAAADEGFASSSPPKARSTLRESRWTVGRRTAQPGLAEV